MLLLLFNTGGVLVAGCYVSDLKQPIGSLMVETVQQGTCRFDKQKLNFARDRTRFCKLEEVLFGGY